MLVAAGVAVFSVCVYVCVCVSKWEGGIRSRGSFLSSFRFYLKSVPSKVLGCHKKNAAVASEGVLVRSTLWITSSRRC